MTPESMRGSPSAVVAAFLYSSIGVQHTCSRGSSTTSGFCYVGVRLQPSCNRPCRLTKACGVPRKWLTGSAAKLRAGKVFCRSTQRSTVHCLVTCRLAFRLMDAAHAIGMQQAKARRNSRS